MQEFFGLSGPQFYVRSEGRPLPTVVYEIAIEGGDTEKSWPLMIRWLDAESIWGPTRFSGSIRIGDRDIGVSREYPNERQSNFNVGDGPIIHGTIVSLGEQLLDGSYYHFCRWLDTHPGPSAIQDDDRGMELACNAARITALLQSVLMQKTFQPIVMEVFGSMPMTLKLSLLISGMSIELRPDWNATEPATVRLPEPVGERAGYFLPVELLVNETPVLKGVAEIVDSESSVFDEGWGSESLLALTMGVAHIRLSSVFDPDCKVEIKLVSARR